METKLTLLFKLFVRSYLFRKKGLNDTIRRLEGFYEKVDEMEDMEADSFSTMVTQSIMDIHETSMKNDDMLIKFIELIEKYESDEELGEHLSDTVFDIDDNIENIDDFDQDEILEQIKDIK